MTKKELQEDNRVLKAQATKLANANKKLRSELAEVKIWMSTTRPYNLMPVSILDLFKNEHEGESK